MAAAYERYRTDMAGEAGKHLCGNCHYLRSLIALDEIVWLPKIPGTSFSLFNLLFPCAIYASVKWRTWLSLAIILGGCLASFHLLLVTSTPSVLDDDDFGFIYYILLSIVYGVLTYAIPILTLKYIKKNKTLILLNIAWYLVMLVGGALASHYVYLTSVEICKAYFPNSSDIFIYMRNFASWFTICTVNFAAFAAVFIVLRSTREPRKTPICDLAVSMHIGSADVTRYITRSYVKCFSSSEFSTMKNVIANEFFEVATIEMRQRIRLAGGIYLFSLSLQTILWLIGVPGF